MLLQLPFRPPKAALGTVKTTSCRYQPIGSSLQDGLIETPQEADRGNARVASLSHAKVTEGEQQARLRFLRHIIRKRVGLAAVQCSIAVLALAFIAIVSSRLHLNLAAVSLLFLIVIALLSRVVDFLSAGAVCIIASLWLAYIAPPNYSIRIDDPLDVVTVSSFLIVSLMIAWLMSRLREVSEQARSSVNRKLIDAEERVSARIGKELHDDIEQRLALLAVQAAQSSPDFAGSAAELLNSMSPIQHQASAIAADVQALAYELRPYRVEYLGLAPVMKSICGRFSTQHDVEIDFKCHGLPSALPLETSISLIRVLQEALHNAAQHSGAHYIVVELFGMSEAIHLAIHDAGVGFNPQAAIRGSGLGLVSMQERMKLVNGHFSVRSQPGEGATVHAYVPLRKRANENLRVAFRISPAIAAMAGAAIFLAIVIRMAQVHHLAPSKVDEISSPARETRQSLESKHGSAKIRGKRSYYQKEHPKPPSPAFRRVSLGPNEVDYVAEDVTIRYFAARRTRTHIGSAGKRVSIGDDVTVQYFSDRPTIVSQAAPDS